jgi:hypothetical protein
VPGARNRRLGSYDRARTASRERLGWCRGLCAKTEEAVSAPEIRIGSVIESVRFEHPSMVLGSEAPEIAEDGWYVRDAKLDLSFMICAAANRHSSV